MTGGGAAAAFVSRVPPPSHVAWLGARPGSVGALAIMIAIGASVLIAAFTITVVVLGFSQGSGNDDGHDEGGLGGGGPKPPPEPGPSDPDPPWWPEFEREFARHVARRSTHERRSPDTIGV